MSIPAKIAQLETKKKALVARTGLIKTKVERLVKKNEATVAGIGRCDERIAELRAQQKKEAAEAK